MNHWPHAFQVCKPLSSPPCNLVVRQNSENVGPPRPSHQSYLHPILWWRPYHGNETCWISRLGNFSALNNYFLTLAQIRRDSIDTQVNACIVTHPWLSSCVFSYDQFCFSPDDLYLLTRSYYAAVSPALTWTNLASRRPTQCRRQWDPPALRSRRSALLELNCIHICGGVRKFHIFVSGREVLRVDAPAMHRADNYTRAYYMNQVSGKVAIIYGDCEVLIRNNPHHLGSRHREWVVGGECRATALRLHRSPKWTPSRPCRNHPASTNTRV